MVACVDIGCDISHFVHKTDRMVLSEFDPLAEFDQKSKEMIRPEHTVPGRAFYSHMGTVHPKYMGTKLMLVFFLEITKYLATQGYEMVYTRVSN